MGCYDRVIPYAQLEALSNEPSVYLDIAGNVDVRSRLHRHPGDHAIRTLLVGATHWDQFAKSVDGGALPGSEPEVFFAPARIDKRDAEWVRGAMMSKAYAASIELMQQLAPTLVMESYSGVEACDAMWQALLDNQISGQRSIMMSLQSEA